MSNQKFQEWLIEHNLKEMDKDILSLKFKEFWDAFPQKTPSGRVLKPKSIKAKTAMVAYKLFKTNVKSEEEANLTIRALGKDIVNRIKTNRLEYLNNINTYIRNKTWEMFEDLESQEDEEENEEGTNFNIL